MNDTVTPIQPEDDNKHTPFNPLVTNNDMDTAFCVSCVLEYLQSLQHDRDALHGDSGNWRYGRHMIYDVMIKALRRGEIKEEVRA